LALQASHASDQRNPNKAVAVPLTLQSALAKEPEAPLERILEIAEGLSDLPKGTYPCLNPRCQKPCAYPAKGSKGHRPQRFCSRECRLKFERARARLVWEVDRLTELRGGPLTTRQEIVLNREISRRQWALDRYPHMDRDGAAVVPTRHVAPQPPRDAPKGRQ
jgi:hypothetical protein